MFVSGDTLPGKVEQPSHVAFFAFGNVKDLFERRDFVAGNAPIGLGQLSAQCDHANCKGFAAFGVPVTIPIPENGPPSGIKAFLKQVANSFKKRAPKIHMLHDDQCGLVCLKGHGIDKVVVQRGEAGDFAKGGKACHAKL